MSLRIIPLGGLGEVGKNMTVYEHGDEIVIVDAGLAFPRDEHLGVDLVLPDIGYLRDRRVNAVVLTHGHEDHVGGLPYLLREVDCDQVIGTKLTLGLIKSKLDEHGLSASTQLQEAETGKPIQVGSFTLDFVRVAHSIPDCVAIVLETEAGRVVHTGDWKLDHTPVDGLKTDVGRFAELGNQGVDLLLGDSTNAERPGMTGSERLVGEAFRTLMPLRKGRILVVSFASNVHRMQQAIDVAIQVGRKVAIVGRSMRKNLNIARALGYLDVPEHILIKPQEAMELPPGQVMILCTGSQGEPMSALTRIAYNDHPSISVERGDTVIISAKPVPGNELRVHDSINRLAKAGAEVLHQEIAPVHVSGHACSEEMRTLLSLIRPRAMMPVHGEYRMLAAHGQLALESGVPADAIIIAENGSVVELERGKTPRIVDRIEAGVTFVDGLGVGDVRDVALRDRRRLSEDGVLIIVTTLASLERRRHGAAGADRARLRRLRGPARRAARGSRARPAAAGLRRHHRDQAAPGAPARRGRPGDLRPHPAAADDSPGRDRGLMASSGRTFSSATQPSELTARRLIAQLRACEAAALSFCRLLERWGRGEAKPATAGGREAALRHAADRVETALAGLETPLGRYLLELEADQAEGRSWYTGPGAGELVEWRPVLDAGPASTRARTASPRPISSWPCSCARSRASPTPHGSTRRRTRRRSGRASSTCATRCSARPSTTSGRSPPELVLQEHKLDRQPARFRARTTACVTGTQSRVSRPSITVVGSVNLDLVARVERLPRPGETVTDATFERVPGGKGANQAVACARLGADVTLRLRGRRRRVRGGGAAARGAARRPGGPRARRRPASR